MTGEPLSRNERTAVAGLTLLVGLTRFIPLSRGPWDWDEVLFCLSLGDYNVAVHQPHPLGFPLFVLLGKFFRLFVSSDFGALQTVNILASIAVFPVLFWLARALRMDFVTSLGAALLFAFLPNVWFYGGTAFSDPLGMVLFLAVAAAYLTAGSDARRYLAASLLLAAALLVRPQNLFVAIFPWTIATVRLLRERRFRPVAGGTLIVVLLVAAGYGAAAWATGFDAYYHAVIGHTSYVRHADSIEAAYRPPLWEVARIQLDPYEAGKASLLIDVLMLAALIRGRRKTVAEILLIFAPFFLFAIFAVNPGGSSRFSLNYVAAFALLAAEGTDALGRIWRRGRIAIHAVVMTLLIGRLVTWILPAFATPRATLPPPVSAALWLRAHVPETSTIFNDGSWPWPRYYLPHHKQVVVSDIGDMLQRPDSAGGWFFGMGASTTDGAILFLRPRNRTWNVVTQRNFESFVAPAGQMVEFGNGWHGPEQNGADSWRWAGSHSWTTFGPAREPRELRLRFDVPLDAIKHPVTVRFLMNGAPLGTFVATRQEGNEVRFVVSPRADRPNVLEIAVSDAFVPARLGGSDDHRELALMLHSWTWRPAAIK